MTTIRKHSAGGVVYCDGRILTINWRTKVSTEFPKGGIEKGESAQQAALREVEEETGYRTRIVAPLGAVSYEYDDRGRHCRKTVDYFLMELPLAQKTNPRPRREPGEYFDDLWLSARQANKRLTHDDSRLILGRATDIINLLTSDKNHKQRYIDTAARHISQDFDFMPVIVDCLNSKRHILAKLAAESLVKLAQLDVDSLQPFADNLIDILKSQSPKEVRAHLSQILPSLELGEEQLATVCDVWFNDFYNSSSSLLQVASLQAMHDIADRYSPANKQFTAMLDSALEGGASAVRTRAKRLS